MKVLQTLAASAVAVFALTIPACSDDPKSDGDDDSAGDDDSKPTGDGGTSTSEGGGGDEETAILVDIGPEGGIITFRKLTMKVPAGALEELLTIQMEVIGRAAPAGVSAKSETYRLGPRLAFKKGVTLTFESQDETEAPLVYWSRGDGVEFAALQTTRSPLGPKSFDVVVPAFGDGLLGAPAANTCTDGKTPCGAGTAGCADLLADPANCGQCGFSCSGGACADGRCKNDGETEKACIADVKNRWCPVLGVGTDCPDVTASRVNCGSCGFTCSTGTCQAGICTE